MLFEMVRSMGKEEVRLFKLLIGRVEAEQGRATVKLFDYLRRHSTEPTTEACVSHLYGEDSPTLRNRLYAIRNKLLREVQRCLVFQHRDLDHEQNAIHDFLLARILLKKGRSRLARNVLDRAYRDADKADMFHVKEFIFRELLGLAGEDLEVPVQLIIDRRKENDHKLEFIRSSQNAMAYIMQTLRKTNFATGGANVVEVMAKLQMQLEENQDLFQSPRGRIRLFNLTSNLLLQQSAFPQLEIYLRREYAFFEERSYFDRSTHRTRIVMLTWLVNTTYKNFRFEDSLSFSKLLLDALEAYNRLFYDQFILVYQNGVVNNFIGLGRTQEAVTRLDNLVKEEKLMQDHRAVYLLINLAEALFELGKLRLVLRTLAKVYLHEGFKMLAPQNQLHVYLFELVVRYDDGDHEYLVTRVQQLRNWFAELLASPHPQRALMDLIERNAHLQSESAFTLKHLDWSVSAWNKQDAKPFLPGENEIIDYRLWLRSKEEGKKYRELLLETIKANAGA